MRIDARLRSSTHRAVAILLVAAMLAIAAIGYTVRHWHRASSAVAHVSGELASLDARIARARLHAAESTRLQERMQSLAAAGLVSTGDLASWRDAVRRAQQSVPVANVEAELLDEAAVREAPSAGTERPHIQESRVRLRIGALHEEELLRFLEALSRERAGVLHVRRCSLRRNGERMEVSPPPMEASCDVAWKQALIGHEAPRR